MDYLFFEIDKENGRIELAIVPPNCLNIKESTHSIKEAESFFADENLMPVTYQPEDSISFLFEQYGFDFPCLSLKRLFMISLGRRDDVPKNIASLYFMNKDDEALGDPLLADIGLYKGLIKKYDLMIDDILDQDVLFLYAEEEQSNSILLDAYTEKEETFKNKILNNDFDKLLFFDIECSNTLGGKGKICEFSYIITDKTFKILKKEENLYNPGPRGSEFDFMLMGRGYSKDLHLKYEANDYKMYREAKEFNSDIERIRDLLSDPDTICLGYGVANDLRYLDYSFKRYGAKELDIHALEVQNLTMQGSSPSSLSSFAETILDKDTFASIRFHGSIDDSIATMEVLKAYLSAKGIDIKESLIQSGDGSIKGSLKTILKESINSNRKAFYKEIKSVPEDINAYTVLKNQIMKLEKDPKCPTVFFSPVFEAKKEAYDTLRILDENGYSYNPNPITSDYIICYSPIEIEYLKKRYGEDRHIILFDQIESLLH